MGYFSELQIAINEGPQITKLNKNICSDCVVDDALRVLVNQKLTSVTCDYCGEDGEDGEGGFIATPFDFVMERIYESVIKEFSDAQDVQVPWIEGEWFLAQKYTDTVLEYFDPGWGDDFLEDIAQCFEPNIYWVKHSEGDWSIEDPSKTLQYGWSRFKEQVLTKTRYLFMLEASDEQQESRLDHIPIAKMLDALGVVCREENLVKTVPAGTEFFRVRSAKSNEVFTEFSELGVPPVGKAGSGRMNPGGISYLYLAYSQDTAEKETLTWGKKVKKWYVAKFNSKVDLQIIDFSQMPLIPSLFEPNKYESRHNRYFLHDFIDDLIKPVKKDEKEHVDYVPTQIVSEYFRHEFKIDDSKGIIGIRYPSVKDEGGTNLAVFSSCNDELKKIFGLLEISEFNK